MPGVLNCNSQCGFSRVGKMAYFMHPDLSAFNDSILNDHREILDSFLESSYQIELDNAESDCDLPDNEHPVDLLSYLDSPNHDLDHHLHQNKCVEGCNNCARNYSKYAPVFSQDPFMGMESARSNTSASSLDLVGPADCDCGSEEFVKQESWDSKIFSGWNVPKIEDEPDYMVMVSRSSVGWPDLFDDDTSGLTFPETPSPSAQSSTNTGDDSDVDIETITDAPRSADSCGYVTQDSTPSPSASSEPIWKFQNDGFSATVAAGTALAQSRIQLSASLNMKSSSTHKTLRTSESTSNRSNMLGLKRKQSKDKKLTSKTHSQPAYTNVLCNSNSVNFHDYAMSPGACTYPSSTETGRPTVLSKRIYKRFITVDSSGKEKQHHHNQLERNRRQKLADLFVDLRDEVPKISGHAKASKVLILNEATLYIHELQKMDKHQEDNISKEQRRKDILKRQLRYLQSQSSNQCVK